MESSTILAFRHITDMGEGGLRGPDKRQALKDWLALLAAAHPLDRWGHCAPGHAWAHRLLVGNSTCKFHNQILQGGMARSRQGQRARTVVHTPARRVPVHGYRVVWQAVHDDLLMQHRALASRACTTMARARQGRVFAPAPNGSCLSHSPKMTLARGMQVPGGRGGCRERAGKAVARRAGRGSGAGAAPGVHLRRGHLAPCERTLTAPEHKLITP